MSDKDHGEHGPIIITDKREQKRQAAREKAQAANHPAAEGTEPAAVTIDRLERIQQIVEAGRERDLTAEEAKELLDLQAAEDQQRQDEAPPDAIPALTAFLVIVGHDGSARATSDVNVNLLIDREANVDDMFTGASLVVRDINAATTSKHVVFGLNVSAQAMQEKAQAMRMVQQAAGPGLAGRRR